MGFGSTLAGFTSEAGNATIAESLDPSEPDLKKYTNEFWTSKQRAASSIHEISYRACFKPQLPRFFINLLTKKGDIVYERLLQRSRSRKSLNPLLSNNPVIHALFFKLITNPLCR